MPGLVLSLFLSLLKTAMLQLNVKLAQARWLRGAIKAWLHTVSFCLCFLLCCHHSSSHSLQYLLFGSLNPGTKCVCPTSWSSDTNTETTTPHTTMEDDSSPRSPSSPPLVSPNPISKAWVFSNILVASYSDFIPAAVLDCSLARLGPPQLLWSCISIWMGPIRGWIMA